MGPMKDKKGVENAHMETKPFLIKKRTGSRSKRAEIGCYE